MVRKILLNLLFVLFEVSDSYIVNTNKGKIKGAASVTLFNERFYIAFYSVPYALPPIEELRFKNPRPLKKWKSVLDATMEYHGACAQGHIVHKRTIYGNEDCLFLNIFTPGLFKSGTPLKPVLIWIHGYAFASSLSHIHGADFFIDKDLVVVTVSHRIGPFGFLKLNDTDEHSNMGLKDIVMALKWVRRNIKKFGGDRNNLTVMGSGSGATFISLLMATDANKLFAKVILQSGTMFSPSLFQSKQYLERERLEMNLKKRGIKSIEKASSEDIVKELGNIYSNIESINAQIPLIPFLPTIESTIMKKPLLIKTPEQYLDEVNFYNLKPILIGFNSKESISEIMPFLHNPSYLKSVGVYFKYLLPFTSKCKYSYSTLTYQKIAKMITREYFKEGLTENSILEFLEYTSDLIKYPIYKFIKRYSQLKNSKMHVYKFTYSGNFSVMKLNAIMGTKAKIKGAASGDEICYMMKCEPLWEHYVKAKSDLENRDRIFIDRITELWANFARTGYPTPKSYKGVTWPPMTENKDVVLNIGKVFDIVNSKKEKRMFKFWNDIYQEYYKDCVRLHDEL